MPDSNHQLRLAARLPGVALLALLLLGGCGQRVELPPLPAVSTVGLLQGVAEQMQAARAAADRNGSDAQANGHYGLVLATYGRDAAAAVALQRARLLAPESVRWPYYHAFVLRRMGDAEGALAALNLILAKRPGQPDALVKRAQIYFELARFDAAQADVAAVLAGNPRYPLARYYAGRLHGQHKAWPEAIALFEGMLADGINAVEVHHHLGTAYRMTGEAEKAARHLALASSGSNLKIAGFDPVYRKLDELNVGDQPHVVRAAELYRRGKVDAAIEQLEIANGKNPANVGTHTHLVRFYGQTGRLDKALSHYEKARDLDPGMPQLHSNMGFAYMYAKRYEEAAWAYRLELQQNSGTAGVHAEYAYALRQAGKAEEALEHFEQSLALQPVNRDLRFVVGETLLNLQRIPEAIEALGSALEPEDLKTAAVYRALARAHGLSGDQDAAVLALQRAREIADRYGNEAMISELDADLAKAQRARRP